MDIHNPLILKCYYIHPWLLYIVYYFVYLEYRQFQLLLHGFLIEECCINSTQAQ